MPYVVTSDGDISVKAALSVSVQPSQNNGGDINSCVNLTPNNPNYITLGCAGAAHQNGNDNPPHHSTCVDGRIGPDVDCCHLGITRHSLQVSDIQADFPACG
jgi:hypothetical protein